MTISEFSEFCKMHKDYGEDQESEPEQWKRRRAHWIKHWMRHTAMVPKGFLRYRLLKMLGDKAMSGSEIMTDLEEETSGYWKPSPGSIYPLLAWLQDKGYIKEAELKEAGMRRYTLTEQGKKILQDETRSQEEINKRLHHLGSAWFVFGKQDSLQIRSTARDFGKSVRTLFNELTREHAKEAVLEAKTSLEQVTKQIQEITEKLQNH